jgi:hypothetical protein
LNRRNRFAVKAVRFFLFATGETLSGCREQFDRMNALILSHDFSQPKAAPLSAAPPSSAVGSKRQGGNARKNNALREERPARFVERDFRDQTVPHYLHGGLNE